MTQRSKIEWTELTWNPITGCTKVSDGCKNCYAERMSRRLQLMWQKKYANGFELTLHEDVLDYPYKVKKPSKIFVNSMSDLFHDEVPIKFIKEVFKVMEDNPHHIFQIVTKRAKNMEKVLRNFKIPDNVWLGVTIESNKYLDRLNHLKKLDCKVKFLSLEPLLTEVDDINLEWIDWVIVWWESWFWARPIKEEWVLEIKEKCDKLKIPFFFKQWGWVNKKKKGKLLQWEIYNATPKTWF